MHIIQVRNVNEAYRRAVIIFLGMTSVGTRNISPRGMPTIEICEPVCTVYHKPMERVLFDSIRDANPFFHIVEALWILAGRNDVEWLAYFNKHIAAFSDDGEIFRGAYGARILKNSRVGGTSGRDINQVEAAVQCLTIDPESRRAVLSIWNPSLDQSDMNTKDLPCNTTAYLKIRNGALDITVFCRSNDMLWGAYGANAVQFSVLQEYIAVMLGVPVGIYRQVSDSLHVYTESGPWEKIKKNLIPPIGDRYGDGKSVITRVVAKDIESFHHDLDLLFSMTPEQACSLMKSLTWRTSFFTRTLTPMLAAWHLYKQDELRSAINETSGIMGDSDWLFASHQWFVKRKLNRDLKR